MNTELELTTALQEIEMYKKKVELLELQLSRVLDRSYINWEGIEEDCLNTKRLPDCVPKNIRQWDAFIKQYERVADLVNRKWEPHYNWNTKEEFEQSVNEQFYLGQGYKHSIYECYKDLSPRIKQLFKNVDWTIIETAKRFMTWNIVLYSELNPITKLPLLPKKVGGNFDCSHNKLKSLAGCPEYVGGIFSCEWNEIKTLIGCGAKYANVFTCVDNKLKSLEGCPNVNGAFYCSVNQLTSLKGAPEIIDGNFYCSDNRLTSLKGAPKQVTGEFWCDQNFLTSIKHAPENVGKIFVCELNYSISPDIPDKFPGKDLHKYRNL